MKRVLGMPPQQLLAARTKLLVLMAANRQDVMDDMAVLLRRPSERIAEQRAEQDEENFFFQRWRDSGLQLPVVRGETAPGGNHRAAREKAHPLQRLQSHQIITSIPHPL